MIRPDMATLLAFVCTDAGLPRKALERVVAVAAEQSFNCVTVDGDTSTNDSFVVAATGQGPQASSGRDLLELQIAITAVAQQLAQAIVRDAEGARSEEHTSELQSRLH